jgi:hypothetical protein
MKRERETNEERDGEREEGEASHGHLPEEEVGPALPPQKKKRKKGTETVFSNFCV